MARSETQGVLKLISENGLQDAIARSPSKDRRLVEVAAKFMSDEDMDPARLSACRLTVRWENASGSSGFKRANIVGGLIFSPPGDNRQGRLWEETATLSLEFYNALVSHPVPVSLAAMKSLAGNSSAMDVYVWLSYRLRSLSKPLLISWDELQPQFGFAYSSTKKFRERFLDTLKTALAVYDGACVEAGRSGLTLYPSPPPIAERPPALPRPQSA